eukprot:TRINITY_DN5222_c0_g1_i5.p1 TRINITY_DN5222_c0_g1~~TRINITY_DN5222_c0_g1_i5.p1  ORF type:complete len:1074 (+),score=184.00 TRINITY_DN5222_c0_g1_i5:61-3282(+)
MGEAIRVDDLVSIYLQEIALGGVFGSNFDSIYKSVSNLPQFEKIINPTCHQKLLKNVIRRPDVYLVVVEKDYPTCATFNTGDERMSSVDANTEYCGELVSKDSWLAGTHTLDETQEYRITVSFHQRCSFLGIEDAHCSFRENTFRILEYIGFQRGSGVLQTDLSKSFNMEAKNLFHHIKLLFTAGLITRRRCPKPGLYTNVIFLKKYSPPKAWSSEVDALEDVEEIEEDAKPADPLSLEQSLNRQIYEMVYASGSKGVLQKEIGAKFGFSSKQVAGRCKYICDYFGVIAVPVTVDRQMNYRLVVKSFMEAKDQDVFEQAKALANNRQGTQAATPNSTPQRSAPLAEIDTTLPVLPEQTTDTAGTDPITNVWKNIQLKTKTLTTNFVQRRSALLQLLEQNQVELLGVQLAARLMEMTEGPADAASKSRPDFRTLLRLASDMQQSQSAKIFTFHVSQDQQKTRTLRLICHPSLNADDTVVQDYVKLQMSRLRGACPPPPLSPEVSKEISDADIHMSIFASTPKKRHRRTSMNSTLDSTMYSILDSTLNSTLDLGLNSTLDDESGVNSILEEKFSQTPTLSRPKKRRASRQPTQEDEQQRIDSSDAKDLMDTEDHEPSSRHRKNSSKKSYSVIKYQKLGNVSNYSSYWSPHEDLVLLNILGVSFPLLMSEHDLSCCLTSVREPDPIQKAILIRTIKFPQPQFWNYISQIVQKSVESCQKRYNYVIGFSSFKRALVERISEQSRLLRQGIRLSTWMKLPTFTVKRILEDYDIRIPEYHHAENLGDHETNIFCNFMSILASPASVYTPDAAERLLVHFSNEENAKTVRRLLDSKTIFKDKTRSSGRVLNFSSNFLAMFTSLAPFPDDLIPSLRAFQEKQGDDDDSTIIRPFLTCGTLLGILASYAGRKVDLFYENAEGGALDLVSVSLGLQAMSSSQSQDEILDTEQEMNNEPLLAEGTRIRIAHKEPLKLLTEGPDPAHGDPSSSNIGSPDAVQLFRDRVFSLNSALTDDFAQEASLLLKGYWSNTREGLWSDITDFQQVIELFEAILSTKGEGYSLDEVSTAEAAKRAMEFLVDSW